MVLVIGLTSTSRTSADVQLEMIGNPAFRPTDFAFGTARLHRDFNDNADEFFQVNDEWITSILGDRHVLAHDSGTEYPGIGTLFPGSDHDGFDTEIRRAVAADGGILTDVVTASQFRGRNIYSLNYTLVPFNVASVGNPPGATPYLPDEAFPLVSTFKTFQDGIDIGPDSDATDPQRFEALKTWGIVTDEDGVVRDYTNRQWDHHIVRGYWGNTSTRPTAAMEGEWERQTEIRDAHGNGWNINVSWEVVPRPSQLTGDLSHNSALDIHDLNILIQNVAVDATNLQLDLDEDNAVGLSDVYHWVTDLRNTWIGDANLDGEFNSGDFVNVFTAGKYETDDLALWSEGDWNADERFDSGDFVVAFQGGGYETGRRAATAAVPEPSGVGLSIAGILAVAMFNRRSRDRA